MYPFTHTHNNPSVPSMEPNQNEVHTHHYTTADSDSVTQHLINYAEDFLTYSRVQSFPRRYCKCDRRRCCRS